MKDNEIFDLIKERQRIEDYEKEEEEEKVVNQEEKNEILLSNQ